MTAPKLSVVRGTKRPDRRAPKQVDWDRVFRRPEPARREDDRQVIPLLEGWIRVLERQAGVTDE